MIGYFSRARFFAPVAQPLYKSSLWDFPVQRNFCVWTTLERRYAITTEVQDDTLPPPNGVICVGEVLTCLVSTISSTAISKRIDIDQELLEQAAKEVGLTLQQVHSPQVMSSPDQYLVSVNLDIADFTTIQTVDEQPVDTVDHGGACPSCR